MNTVSRHGLLGTSRVFQSIVAGLLLMAGLTLVASGSGAWLEWYGAIHGLDLVVTDGFVDEVRIPTEGN